MASPSGSNLSWKIDVGEDEYPYPSHKFAINIVTVKLSGKDVYNVWKKQMLCLLTSHDMVGFIDGRFLRPFDGNGKAKDEDMELWIRSDSLVTGWILGSLSKKVAIRIVNLLTSKGKYANFSAKDAWDELEGIYGPSDPEQTEATNSTPEDATSVEEKSFELSEAARKSLYRFILRGITEKVLTKLKELDLKPTDSIMRNGNTSLHVAVGSSTKNQAFLKNMLKEANNELLNVKNSDGSTPLHVAAIVGNIEAVDLLVERNPKLLFAKDKKGHTPLAVSLSNMQIKMSEHLVNHIIHYEGAHTMFSGKSGDELLVLAISSQNFDFALSLVQREETILHSEVVLMAIAQNFPCELGFWERRVQDIDYHAWEDKHRSLTWKFLIFGISNMVSMTMQIVSPFLKDRLQKHKDAKELLWAVFVNIQNNIDSSRLSLPQYYTNPVFEATKLNAFEVVTRIVKYFPDAIWSINKDGLNFIQYAVINRSEKIYSLLYKMSEHRNIYKTIKDPHGNNLLHLAGRLAPANKLNLISGAALRIQCELQWFKEVQEFVLPLARIEKNYADETPQMVFTREHEDLVIEGEKWMKTTAESNTITATLIITIVFAAAITVPGGNNQDTGIPIHNNNIAFTIFAVSDAISLFTAVTSLLMFLSILTTRFSAEDFLFKLPRRVIIGLAALFISTSAMIIAFGASLFLVFGHDNSWILIPIGVLTCLPITSFVTLQFPLILDLTDATYYGHMFDKRKSDEYFY